MNLMKLPTTKKIAAITAAALISTTALVGVASTSMPANAQIAVQNVAPFSFADLVEAVRPAVVSIRVKTEIVQTRGPRFDDRFEMPDLPEGHPFEDFFKRFDDQFGHVAMATAMKTANNVPVWSIYGLWLHHFC